MLGRGAVRMLLKEFNYTLMLYTRTCLREVHINVVYEYVLARGAVRMFLKEFKVVLLWHEKKSRARKENLVSYQVRVLALCSQS